MNASQKSNYITRVRNQSIALLEAVEELHALAGEWTALDLGNVLTDQDFLGENEGLTVSQIAAVIGTTLPAIESLLAKGHATNLYRLVK